jgi:hypothetical protein
VNEAAERLYATIHDEARDESWEGELKEQARAALAEERRLTVERIREKIDRFDEDSASERGHDGHHVLLLDVFAFLDDLEADR